MTDDTRRPQNEPEFDEPVFKPDDPTAARTEPEFAPVPPGAASDPEPPLSPEATPYASADTGPIRDAAEPVFAADGDPVDPQGMTPRQAAPEPSGADIPDRGTAPDERVLENTEERRGPPQPTPEASTGWVNIAPDSEMTVEPVPETGDGHSDETAAADAADLPPPRRRLGRTGPVLVIGGIALVVIAGVVWLAVTRLTGPANDASQAAAGPAVQQMEAASPTPHPPTATPGPTSTPTPALLKIGANVKVFGTAGQGVNLRAEPGQNKDILKIFHDGTIMVVLPNPNPGSDYPVDADGHLWYRMRVLAAGDAAKEPYVGWCASDFFVEVETEAQ